MTPEQEGLSPVEKLDATHDVESFACGREPLDRFLKRFALANQKADSARTYVACRGLTVLAYYSLGGRSRRTCRRTSPGRQGAGPAPDPGDAPSPSRGRPDLARTRPGQGARQGRTAQNRRRRRHRRYSGTCLSHAKDDEARGWYEALEFEPSPTDPYHLFLLMKGPAGNVERMIEDKKELER